ncbi:MAG TPA: aromatic ring-hydroxylating dioxygenase subunit alpha [Caldilineaceae bacterium]|nr:aromatic ring-hydroxylating dioxygenase subunit alpha [Caldilineaceae bacterium]
MLNDPILINDWHAVARSQELTDGAVLAVRLLAQDLVLWRHQGQALAWQDLCLHRGTRLSLGKVAGDCLVCPYHGWHYDHTGRCVHIPAHPDQTPPAKARSKVFPVRERYGLVWVCLGEPAHEVPPFPEDEDRSFRQVIAGPYLYHAAGPRAVENFLDVAHFPFVHDGYLGDRDHASVEDYTVEESEQGIVARNIRIYQPKPNASDHAIDFTYTYHVYRPLTAHFRKETSGPSMAILLTVTPVEALRSLAWMIIAMNYGHEKSADDIRAFQNIIVGQDVPIVESQRPELLPLDLQAELHLRSDRTAIAYRRWLNRLGLKAGTA